MVVHLRLFDTSQIIWEKLKLKFIYYKELHWRPAYEFATLFCKMTSILNIYNKLPITRYCVTVIALFWACFYSIPTYCNTNLLLSIISWFVLALLTVLGSDIRIYVARVSWFTLQAISLWRSITYLTSQDTQESWSIKYPLLQPTHFSTSSKYVQFIQKGITNASHTLGFLRRLQQ